MENPFTAIADLVHKGLSELHSRVDEGKQAVSKVESDLEAFRAEVSDRLAKIEGLFSGQAVSDAVSKLQSIGSGGPSSAPAAAPTSVNDIVSATVPEADPTHVAAAVEAHDSATAAGSPPEVAHADAQAAASAAGADPTVASKIADAVAANPPSA